MYRLTYLLGDEVVYIIFYVNNILLTPQKNELSLSNVAGIFYILVGCLVVAMATALAGITASN